MASTTITTATLFGSASVVNIPGYDPLVDQQKFGFPGLDTSFVTGLGSKGKVAHVTGILRTAPVATAILAGTALNTIRDAIITFYKSATLLNWMRGESTPMAALHVGDGSLGWVGVIEKFSMGARYFSREGTSYVASAGFQMQYHVFQEAAS